MLRSFLYLDQSLLNEWIEQVLGAIPGDISTHRESGSQGGHLNGGVRVAGMGVEGERTSETSSEWVSDWQLTDIGRFERLYRELGANLTTFSGFDSVVWTGIKGREIIETEGNASIPEVFMKAVEMPALTSFLQIAQAFSGLVNIDDHLPEKAENMIGPMEAYGRIFNEMPLPLVVDLAGDAPYKLVTNLDRQYIRRPIPHFQNDINIIGQITKIIEPGDQEEIYQIASTESASSRPNRHERRAAKSSGRSIDDQSRQTVSGPVLRLNTLAIYR